MLCANRTGGRTCLRAGLDITVGKIKFLATVWKEISVVIKIARLRWAGPVTRMDEFCMPSGLLNMQPEGLR